MVRLPDFPDPEKLFSAIDKANNIFDKGLGLIDMLADKVGPPEKIPQARTPQTIAAKGKGVTDQQTLAYQLDHLLIPLRQLEYHLSENCRILGTPCDCCQKSGMDIRVFSTETISIAARSGMDTSIFAQMAEWAAYIEQIGSEPNSASGKYSETYRKESGNASIFRKRVQAMLSELKATSSEECVVCEGVKTIKEHLEKRKGEEKT